MMSKRHTWHVASPRLLPPAVPPLSCRYRRGASSGAAAPGAFGRARDPFGSWERSGSGTKAKTEKYPEDPESPIGIQSYLLLRYGDVFDTVM